MSWDNSLCFSFFSTWLRPGLQHGLPVCSWVQSAVFTCRKKSSGSVFFYEGLITTNIVSYRFFFYCSIRCIFIYTPLVSLQLIILSSTQQCYGCSAAPTEQLKCYISSNIWPGALSSGIENNTDCVFMPCTSQQRLLSTLLRGAALYEQQSLCIFNMPVSHVIYSMLNVIALEWQVTQLSFQTRFPKVKSSHVYVFWWWHIICCLLLARLWWMLV